MRNDFMAMFGLTIPIVQAPISSIATLDLVQAVGRAGGLGSLAFTQLPLDLCLQNIAALNALEVPYFVNYLLRFGSHTVRQVAAARPPCITLSWGMDAPLIADIQTCGVRVGVMVGSAEGASAAVAAGADFLIVQGMEAGGHVQSSRPLHDLLAGVVARAGQVPVVAAGGIATGRDIAAALATGAQAVMLGTRFVATKESLGHQQYKLALVAAARSDTAYTNCFDIGWPYAMHGVLRNDTFRMWESAGCPAAPDRPGEGKVIARHGDTAIVRYSDTPPLRDAVGDVLAACLYAGAGVAGIDQIEPAGAVTERLWAEALRLM